ncbi:hypothetical protein [Microcoleus asticus]|uniref:hypothetical protein n=1 Tax=Microcoleus asticus TaxID=2815231 RepID=UPI001551D959|nr:hypothetical protein [Microcoleus asticus]
MRSQTNHKTFNGTRDDKLPETADRSPGTPGNAGVPAQTSFLCDPPSKSEVWGRSLLELV